MIHPVTILSNQQNGKILRKGFLSKIKLRRRGSRGRLPGRSAALLFGQKENHQNLFRFR
jgi:hypothetical protein